MDALKVDAAVHSWRGAARTASAALLLAVSLLGAKSALAQLDPSEYDLKAAFLYQFLSYVTWPESKTNVNGLVRIGVMGAPELVENLATIARNQGDGSRTIEVTALPPDADPRNLQVLFVAADVEDAAAESLRIAADNAVLTVTEAVPRRSSSIINFEIIDSKVRFDVALGLARRNGLDISARLLQVALRVVE